MPIPDFHDPFIFVAGTLLFFLIISGRYIVIAALFYAVFYRWFPEKWHQRKINQRPYKKNQLKKEICWSMITALLFAFAGSLTFLAWQEGLTKVYMDVTAYGWWYLPVSLCISMLLHETYYYWLHRWMHKPAIFRIVHKIHHDSNIASPFTAFSFHPIEGLLQAVVLPLTLMILPMHSSMILLQLTIMTFSSVVNHLDIEVYPKGFERNLIGRWIIGATHHALHHKQFKYNYGLYFTFWDKWKKTESPLFTTLFQERTGKASRNLIVAQPEEKTES